MNGLHKISIITMAFMALNAHALVDTMPGSMDADIRTMTMTLNGNDIFAPPVLIPGTLDQLVFSFDNIADDRRYFRYKLVHCNADWQPSGLVDSEIVDGFNEGSIDDFAFSRGTTVNYVNYKFSIPNSDMMPLVSGNYLVKLYDENDPEETLAQWRFMVSEQVADISAMVTSRTDIDYNSSHQQLEIAVDTDRRDVIDPFNDLIVMIQQNGRLDNEVAITHPLRMSDRKAIYEHQPQLIFDAGNEYRRFETVRLDYPGMGVAETEFYHPYYHTILATDTPRKDESYSYDETQNGRYLVREYDSDLADTNADYSVVHFSLEYDGDPSTSIYIDGDLTSRRFDPSTRMTYNPTTGLFEKALLLKQGSYNYQYLAVPQNASRGYTSIIEGDKYQTMNEYLIKVYTRKPGDRYDRLIAVSRIVFDK